MNHIHTALQSLENNIFRNNYMGYDPYDALNSPIFKIPILSSNKTLRFGFQQVFKRIPINLRPLFFINKGLNPVSLGLSIQAYSYLSQISTRTYKEQITGCIDKLIEIASKGYSGTCWGYDFDWEAKYARIPAYVPTIVATGIITNALYENYRITHNISVLPLIINSAEFIMKDLNKHYEGPSFCYTYSPVDKRRVFNATMKGARLLTQVYSLTKDEKYIEEAFKTVEYVLKYQKSNGSWIYSDGEARKWADNYHTGYILDCLDEIIRISGEKKYRVKLYKGLEFYVSNFFVDEKIPKYYSDGIYPIDSTSAAQSILTLSRFGYYDRAGKVINWMLENMFNEKGYFYYQVNKHFTNKTSFMRWSNAWMFCAISYYLKKKNEKN